MKNKFYYKDGTISDKFIDDKILHRTDGPAIESPDGSKFWYIDDNLHRTAGPAVEWAKGDKYWFVNGKQHRIDGPATEYASGSKYWYINDEKYTEEKFNEIIKRIKKLDPILQLTDERWWVRELGKENLNDKN